MIVEVRSSPQSDAQAAEADSWWRAHRPNAPTLFSDELNDAFRMLARAPAMGVPIRRRRAPEVRRFLLPATRYHVYYTYDERRARVLVLAVWSAHRGRGPRLS